MANSVNYILATVIFTTISKKAGGITLRCDPGAEVGKPFNYTCTGIPANYALQNLNVFRNQTSIITCSTSGNCFPIDANKHEVISSPSDTPTFLTFRIKNFTEENIRLNFSCIDGAKADGSSQCVPFAIPTTTAAPVTISTASNSTSDGQSNPDPEPFPVVVIVVIVVVIVVICITIIVICVCWKKKCYCFADKHSEKQKKKETGQEGTALQENPQDNNTNN